MVLCCFITGVALVGACADVGDSCVVGSVVNLVVGGGGGGVLVVVLVLVCLLVLAGPYPLRIVCYCQWRIIPSGCEAN